jgi:SAM-dependent methyltransferase
MTIPFKQRTETYLGESRYDKPKEVFLRLATLVEESGGLDGGSLLDVGCATGELIHYLAGRWPTASFTGLDNQSELLSHARERVRLPRVEFLEGDALEHRGTPHDVVTCFGMLGIFDEFEPLLEALLANCRPGGRVYLHALLNPEDIDVRVLYRDNPYGDAWNRGFNIFSSTRVAAWLDGKGARSRFLPFRLGVDVARNARTPHRAYTVQLADGERRTTNGLCLMLPETILEIRLPT